MNTSNLSLHYNRNTGDYTVRYHDFEWVSDGRRPYVSIRKNIGKKEVCTVRPLMSAGKKTVNREPGQIICTYGGFTAFGKTLDFTLICTAKITGANTVDFSIRAENETGYDIRTVYFPAPFNAKKKGRLSYAVDCMRQGFLMPDGYRENFTSTFAYANYPRLINTGDCYMPLWGRVCDGMGFSAIVLTPYDASMFSSFGKHGAFVNSVRWLSSLGQLRYERKIRFTFHSGCDYNTIAKDYRRYLSESGQLLTLREKMAKNENIKKLLGCPVFHHQIYSNIQPKSQYYDPKGKNESLRASFGKREEQLRKMKSLGLERLYIHTDGWGEQGYDNNHPYILPPCPAAGGWEGMKSLADACREMGYIFALHDQYRDFYYTSPGFDMNKAVTNLDASHPYCSIWDGGEHTYLCSSQAPEYVKTTYAQLEEHGVDVQGAYLDVFAVMNGDECFHPEHPLSREESIRSRGECFDYLNEKGMIMSSEEPAAQLLDKLALVHHGPYSIRPQEDGVAVGIPVPLLNLVFHDCIMIPWNWGLAGNHWGIPITDDPNLHCALNAGMPYIHPLKRSYEKIGKDTRPADTDLLPDDQLKQEIDRVKPYAELQAKLFDQEMVRHEFLGGARRQRATYADGTTVTVDFDKGVWEVGKVKI